MGRREDLNKELSSYLTDKVKIKPRRSKVKEEVPPDISADEVHVIPGEPSWFQKMMTHLKEGNPEKEKEVIEQPIEESPKEFEKEDEKFQEEVKETSFWDFVKGLFKAEEHKEDEDISQENVDKEIQSKPKIAPESKEIIETLIQINVEVLSRLPPEELDRFKRNENYQRFKFAVEKFKELKKTD